MIAKVRIFMGRRVYLRQAKAILTVCLFITWMNDERGRFALCYPIPPHKQPRLRLRSTAGSSYNIERLLKTF